MNNKAIKRRDLILNGNILKALLIISIPTAFNGLILSTYNLIDAFFVSQIGSLEVAVITFVSPINSLVRAISLGLSIAGTNMIAQEIAKEKYESTKNMMKHLLVLSLALGIAIMLFSIIFSKNILLSISATDSLMQAANDYFVIMMFSLPLTFCNSAFFAIKRANGETDEAMYVNFVGIFIKVILTYLMLFVFKFNIIGLAISTFIGQLLVTLYAVYDLFLKNSLLKLTFKMSAFNVDTLVNLVLIGFPIMIEKSSIALGFIVINKYILSFGEIVLAGYGITNNINSLFFSFASGLATGLAPIVSQNLGANNPKRAKKAITLSFIVGIILSSIIGVIVVFNSRSIAINFTGDDPELLRQVVNAMRVYSISVVAYCIFQVTNGVFQGTGKTRYNMLIGLVRIYLFRIPIVTVLVNYTELAEYSIWYTMLISNILTAIFAYILYRLTTRNIALVKQVQVADFKKIINKWRSKNEQR